jgi:hypothetical protein
MEQTTKITFMNLLGDLEDLEIKKTTGEITKEEATKLKKRLKDKWYRLEKKLGRKVTKDELVEEATKIVEKVQPKEKQNFEVETFPEDEVDQEEIDFIKVIAKLPNKLVEKVQDAMILLETSADKFEQCRKAESILKGLVGKENYAIIDLTPGEEKIEITDKHFEYVVKNKSCGTWKHIVNDSNIFVYTFESTLK